jgi:hypothetical protein
MTKLPHDVADLYLAPVALAVDTRITELSCLTDEKLALRVGLESDEPDWSIDLRKDALLRTVGHLIDLHGWSLSWDDRGIRLSHGKHSLILGEPANFSRYVERAPSA